MPPLRWFTEDFEERSDYWNTILIIGAGVPVLRYQRGFLDIQLERENTWILQLFEPYGYTDVHVDALFEPRGSEPSSTGVVCRFSREQGWFEFNLSREGTYNVLIGQWLSEDLVQYVPILYEESEYIKPNTTAFEVGMDCLENDLWLYINGKLIRKVNVERFGLTEGKVGLSVASFENKPVISAFDRFSISEP